MGILLHLNISSYQVIWYLVMLRIYEICHWNNSDDLVSLDFLLWPCRITNSKADDSTVPRHACHGQSIYYLELYRWPNLSEDFFPIYLTIHASFQAHKLVALQHSSWTRVCHIFFVSKAPTNWPIDIKQTHWRYRGSILANRSLMPKLARSATTLLSRVCCLW